jgi:hypothetical protein
MTHLHGMRCCSVAADSLLLSTNHAAAAAADWVFVMWLDTVTYLHHHGPEDAAMKMPWYR